VELAARFRDDTGDLPTVLIAFTLTVLAFYFAVHAALVFHGRSVVAAAAQDALAATQREDGTAGDGYAAANRTLGLSPGLRDVDVSVDINSANTQVRVEVSARVETALIEMGTDVSAVAVGPRERFYLETERP
jgi:hypothetical protein